MVKKLRAQKKSTILEILELCRIELAENFKELIKMNASELLFMVKDTIIPNEMTIAEIETLELKNLKMEYLLNFNNVRIKKDGREFSMSVNLGNPVRVI